MRINEHLNDTLKVAGNYRNLSLVYVALGNNTHIENLVIVNSIVQNETVISHANVTNSMIGNKVTYKGKAEDLSIGDYTEITQ
mgnify:CR=1 FL=1